jgi:hypothetical protein
MNSPPGRETISTPDLLVISIGPAFPDFELLRRVSGLVASPEGGLDFSQPPKIRAAVPNVKKRESERPRVVMGE